MIKVGMQVADRYEIIEKIGTGGMSDVYRAKDHKLNRFVAVKVLKQEFSENSDFVSKFRTEAQAAAGLMHPNIVNVYDVGEESGFHYIVMELVEGITLKKYIEKKARLSVKEAVSIAIQVSMGIEAAHNNHIIHRDIKPQNIIISKEGKVKVTDFGIAKAATSNTITSNVMGSVHYTSPEQVRGGFSDEKSDIYSLGITLFEMLTGRVPFNGETTVAVAIKHIQEVMPSPRDFVTEIPISVEQIVLKCTQKSPDKRYQSAPELIEDLKKSLISPDENFVKIEDDSAIGATKNISDKELAQIKKQSHQRENFDAQMQNTGKTSFNTARIKAELAEEAIDEEGWDEDPVEDEWIDEEELIEEEYVPVPEKKRSSKSGNGKSSKSAKNSKSGKGNKKVSGKKNNKKYDEEYDTKMELITTILVVIAAVIIGAIFLVIVTKAIGLDFSGGDKDSKKVNTNSSDNVMQVDDSSNSGDIGTDDNSNVGTVAEVPPVIGLPRNEATKKLEDEGFDVTAIPENSSTVEKNYVISQDIEAGSKVKRGSTITIVYSIGEESVIVNMPSVIGLPEEDALVTLGEKGIVIEPSNIIEEYNDQYDAGVVFYQSVSAGFDIDVTTPITIKVSLGPEQVYYGLNYTINQPSDYVGGDVTVVIRAADGTEIDRMTQAGFPINVVKTDIFGIANGSLDVIYLAQEAVTNADGTTAYQNVQKTQSAAVNFVKMQ